MVTITYLPFFSATAAAGFLYAKSSDYTTLQAELYAFAIALPIWMLYCGWIYPVYLSPLRHIPTVPGFPLWGQFYEIITTEVGVSQRTWHVKYGPIIRYFFPFGSERLSVVDDDALKHMTVRNPYNYPKPVRAKMWMVRILGEGVLLAEGDEHIHQRKSLLPGFSIQSIRALSPVFWQKSLLMSKLWKEEMKADNVKQKPFEVLEWLNRTTLDIIGEAGFGTDINSLENPDRPIREAYRLVFAFDIVSRMLHGLQAFITATKYIPAKMNRDIEKSRKAIMELSTDIVNDKISQAKEHTAHKDIIALIAKENLKLQEAGEPGLTFETMRDQIMTFLGAGHDTTATGVAWCLHLLSKHPEIQTKLREEIRQHMPHLFGASRDTMTVEKANTVDPDQLPYMDNVCRESLRYIPPIPMTVREAINDDKLCGYFIPAGTIVYVLANTINHLESYWGPTAGVFDPDRWDHLPKTYTANAMMTFLQGPRGCIGRKFAETEMKILLCCLLSQYQFERDENFADPEDWKMWRLVLRPKDGVSLKTTML